MSTRDLIDAIETGDASGIETSFNDIMATKVSERLDSMRDVMAQNMFKAPEMEADEEELTDEEEFEESYDSSGAYAKHDPKHPDFVKNYNKYKAGNPEAKLADFVAHMKKQK